MDLLSRAADKVGRAGGIHGLWLLVPANDQNPLPTIEKNLIALLEGAIHTSVYSTSFRVYDGPHDSDGKWIEYPCKASYEEGRWR